MRAFLDDPLLPHTIDEPILDRLRDFVMARHGGYNAESAEAVATLLMAMMTTRTTNYEDLGSLLKYLRSAPPNVHAFLRDEVLRPHLYPHADKAYPRVCLRAAAEFAVVDRGGGGMVLFEEFCTWSASWSGGHLAFEGPA